MCVCILWLLTDSSTSSMTENPDNNFEKSSHTSFSIWASVTWGLLLHSLHSMIIRLINRNLIRTWINIGLIYLFYFSENNSYSILIFFLDQTGVFRANSYHCYHAWCWCLVIWGLNEQTCIHRQSFTDPTFSRACFVRNIPYTQPFHHWT